MAENLFLSDSYYKENAVSLKLKPLENFERQGNKTDTFGNNKEGLKYFEIQHPVSQATILDIIYPLIQVGITKARVYAVEASSQAINRWVLEAPALTQDLWEKLKIYFVSNEEIEDKEKSPIIVEDEDYFIIKENEKEASQMMNSQLSKTSYDVMSSSMLKSSFVSFCCSKLKSINLLRRMDKKENDSNGDELCPSLNFKDQKYNNSFNLSNESIAYAPRVSLSSFEAINRLAAEFELVGNQIVIKEIEEMIKLP